MLDIVSIGDTTHDIFIDLPTEAAGVNCEIDRQECKLMLGYGDKLPINHLTHVYAVGNAANNAVGMARLGFNNAVYTNLGNDDSSNQALEIFAKEKVGLDLIAKNSDKPGNLSVVINYEGERVILVHHEKWIYKLPSLQPAPKFIYYTSVAQNHESLNDELVSFVKENNVKLGFNPGTYQIKKGLDILKPVMAVTYAFIVNRLEAGRILGIQVKQEERDDNGLKALLLGIHNLGVKNVVITDGPIGTYAYDGNDYYYLKPNDVPVVERTGTGDAFSTGFMSGLIKDQTIAEAMRWGALNSESVLQFIGARDGLLTEEKMQVKLLKYKNFKAERI